MVTSKGKYLVFLIFVTDYLDYYDWPVGFYDDCYSLELEGSKCNQVHQGLMFDAIGFLRSDKLLGHLSMQATEAFESKLLNDFKLASFTRLMFCAN